MTDLNKANYWKILKPVVRNRKILRYVDSIVRGTRNFPPSLHIALTDHCWNRCPICSHHKRKQKAVFDWAQLENLLRYGTALGLETVCLTGGDPLRYQNINVVMELCLELGLGYGIVTAGYCPSWASERLLEKAQWIRCSIDAVGSAPYKAVRGGLITWNRVKDSLQRLYTAGANLQVFTTISRHNEAHLDTLCAWLFKHKTMFSELRARPVYKSTGIASQPTNAVTAKVLSHWTKKFSDVGMITDFTAKQFDPLPVQRCWAVKYQLFIGADGYIYPCCITAGDTEDSNRVKPFGNIKHVPQGDEQPGKPWQQCLENIDSWVSMPGMDLPLVCLHECAPRFNRINTTLSDNLLAEKNFF